MLNWHRHTVYFSTTALETYHNGMINWETLLTASLFKMRICHAHNHRGRRLAAPANLYRYYSHLFFTIGMFATGVKIQNKQE